MLKIQLNGAASRPVARRPREGSAKHLDLRHSLLHQNMSVVPATARSKRARGVLGGGGDRPPSKSVWADAHGLDLDLDLDLDLEIDFKIAPFAPIRAKKPKLT